MLDRYFLIAGPDADLAPVNVSGKHVGALKRLCSNPSGVSAQSIGRGVADALIGSGVPLELRRGIVRITAGSQIEAA